MANTPFAPTEDRTTPGSDLSAELELCEPQEAGSSLRARPANYCRGKFKTTNPMGSGRQVPQSH